MSASSRAEGASTQTLDNRGDAAAHAVELPAVGVRRSHRRGEQRLPGRAIGRQVRARGT